MSFPYITNSKNKCEVNLLVLEVPYPLRTLALPLLILYAYRIRKVISKFKYLHKNNFEATNNLTFSIIYLFSSDLILENRVFRVCYLSMNIKIIMKLSLRIYEC